MPKLLFIGDIVGRPGRDIIKSRLPHLRNKLALDFIIANGENSAGGAGITASITKELLDTGIDAITLGDHVWDQRGFDDDIDDLKQVCRPANLPDACPGSKFLIIERNKFRLGIFTVLGQHFMTPKPGSPFRTADKILDELKDKTDAILVEIHAEATSEKIAMGWYLDGRASAVVGTHTHIPTADATVLARGTAYITDVGMTGPYQSVLGREIQPIVARFLDGMPRKCPVAENDARICGCIVNLNADTGMADSIERVSIPV